MNRKYACDSSATWNHNTPVQSVAASKPTA